MAIYHLHVKTGSKGTKRHRCKTGSKKPGQTALDKCNYILREGKYQKDHITKESRHVELGFSISENMPSWVERPQEYWAAADKYERADGSLYKQIQIALPIELTSEQQQELALKFARKITQDENLPYTLGIHIDKEHNPHCHLIISERANDGHNRTLETWFKRAANKPKENDHDYEAKMKNYEPSKGGAIKTRTFMEKSWLNRTRELWQNMGNDALERAGFERSLDHRSYKAQGKKKIPGVHVGRSLFKRQLNEEIKNKNIAIEQEEQLDKQHEQLVTELESVQARKEQIIEIDKAEAEAWKTEIARAEAEAWAIEMERLEAASEQERLRLAAEDRELELEEIAENARQQEAIDNNNGYIEIIKIEGHESIEIDIDELDEIGIKKKRTRNGYTGYYLDSQPRKPAFVDVGKKLYINSIDDKALLMALNVAYNRWGAVQLSGSEEFVRRCEELAVQNNIPLILTGEAKTRADSREAAATVVREKAIAEAKERTKALAAQEAQIRADIE